MDEFIRNNFFSRQGKATKHFFNGFKQGTRREVSKEDYKPEPIQPVKLLEQVIKERNEAKRKAKSTLPSSFFRSIGRDFSLPPSDSPGAGQYSPRYDALDARVNQGPRYSKPSINSKKQKIYLPICLNSEFHCQSHNTSPPGEIDQKINKTIMNLEDFESKSKAFRSLTPVPDILHHSVPSPIKFSLQKPRAPFVNPNSAPNEKRFAYCPSVSDVLTKFKRPESVDFSKMSFRIDAPIMHSSGPYNVNKEYVMPKLVKNVPNFSKQVERKPLVLEHLLKSPESPDLSKYNEAYYKLGNVKGPTKLPLMNTQTARDDAMYKVTEGYSLNSKRSQSPN